MNDKEFLEFLENVLMKEELDIIAKKGHEYSGEDNRFNNFEKLGRDLGIHPLTVAAIYMKKHIDSILTFIKDDFEVTSEEDILGRINDARNYLAIMAGMVKKYRGFLDSNDWVIREYDLREPLLKYIKKLPNTEKKRQLMELLGVNKEKISEIMGDEK